MSSLRLLIVICGTTAACAATDIPQAHRGMKFHRTGALALFSGMPELRLADAAGGTQKLYLSPDDRDLAPFAMPPAPPAGAFDARFSGGSAAARVSPAGEANAPAVAEAAISMQGVIWPLTIDYSSAGATGGDVQLVEYTGGRIAAIHDLVPDRKIVISGGEGHSLAVRTAGTQAVPTSL